jgi:hypothetical protein
MKAITDVESNAAMSRDQTVLNPWNVLPAIESSTTPEIVNASPQGCQSDGHEDDVLIHSQQQPPLYQHVSGDVTDDVVDPDISQQRQQQATLLDNEEKMTSSDVGHLQVQYEETSTQVSVASDMHNILSRPIVNADDDDLEEDVEVASEPQIQQQVSEYDAANKNVTITKNSSSSSNNNKVIKHRDLMKQRRHENKESTNLRPPRKAQTKPTKSRPAPGKQSTGQNNGEELEGEQEQDQEQNVANEVFSAENAAYSSSEPEESEEEDFVIVRDDSPNGNSTPQLESQSFNSNSHTSGAAQNYLSGQDELSESDMTSTSTNAVSRDQRVAQRQAQAARRREEVERRRLEREEQRILEKAEELKRQQMAQELEQERQKREEQYRLEKERREEEKQRKEAEELELERQAREKAEREKRQQEEYNRKLELLRMQQADEERLKQVMAERLRQAELEMRRQEMLRLAAMNEAERLEYERQKREQEKLAQKLLEEEKRRREEEERRLADEAARLSEQLSEEQEILRRRLEFHRNLQLEAQGLEFSHEITRAFKFSYIQLMRSLAAGKAEQQQQVKNNNKTKTRLMPNTAR